jgi:hypothetical protein
VSQKQVFTAVALTMVVNFDWTVHATLKNKGNGTTILENSEMGFALAYNNCIRAQAAGISEAPKVLKMLQDVSEKAVEAFLNEFTPPANADLELAVNRRCGGGMTEIWMEVNGKEANHTKVPITVGTSLVRRLQQQYKIKARYIVPDVMLRGSREHEDKAWKEWVTAITTAFPSEAAQQPEVLTAK